MRRHAALAPCNPMRCVLDEVLVGHVLLRLRGVTCDENVGSDAQALVARGFLQNAHQLVFDGFAYRFTWRSAASCGVPARAAKVLRSMGGTEARPTRTVGA